MASEDHPLEPSLPWRAGSIFLTALVGAISRAALYGANKTETRGLDGFLSLLDRRKDVDGRKRGLITVSNHLSVIDDPLIWGVLPIKYDLNPNNTRWSLGSYDLCFTNKGLSTFFSLGQVLPTHRLKHSRFGGLFQPTMTQAVRLVSDFGPKRAMSAPGELLSSERKVDRSFSRPDISDPFSSPHLTFSTNGTDTFPAPAAYSSRKYSWIHIFPEGRVHQHPLRSMRYFKWGVARLILEPDECPDVIPMWIEGSDLIMHESRQFPRFIPRLGKNMFISFGENVGGEQGGEFADMRRRWRRLVEKDQQRRRKEGAGPVEDTLGELSEELKYGREAVELRKECTLKVREKVLSLRATRGYPEEDPKASLVETWIEEGSKSTGQMDDGSYLGPT